MPRIVLLSSLFFLAEDLHIGVLFLRTCPDQPLDTFSETGLVKGGEEMLKQKAIRARKIRIVISTNEHARAYAADRRNHRML